MGIITNILSWISTGFLLPVIILLLICFIFALIQLGEMYGEFTLRLKRKKAYKNLCSTLIKTKPQDIKIDELNGLSHRFKQYVFKFQQTDYNQIHAEKIISDYKNEIQNAVNLPNVLMRVGPMLGLMGTLIPMGPALSGLASGDIHSMAHNMQIAFATTVIGIFIGAIGFLSSLLRKKWFEEEYDTLIYLFNLGVKND